jgi:hypothetical protein
MAAPARSSTTATSGPFSAAFTAAAPLRRLREWNPVGASDVSRGLQAAASLWPLADAALHVPVVESRWPHTLQPPFWRPCERQRVAHQQDMTAAFMLRLQCGYALSSMTCIRSSVAGFHRGKAEVWNKVIVAAPITPPSRAGSIVATSRSRMGPYTATVVPVTRAGSVSARRVHPVLAVEVIPLLTIARLHCGTNVYRAADRTSQATPANTSGLIAVGTPDRRPC